MGQRLGPEDAFVSWKSPLEVMVKEADDRTGEFQLADQTMVWSSERFEYQIEKMKRFGEVGDGRKPAVKVELGERRVRFLDGFHGDSAMEKEDIDWANEDEDVKKWIMKKKIKRRYCSVLNF